jgi:predicted TIM-barrel fold metal-dependent hydrolase
MKEALNDRKIDAYANAYSQEESAKTQIDFADRLGIEKLILAVPVAKKMGETPKEFRAYNDLVIKAVKRYPKRLAGQLTLNPVYLKESLEEIKRCIGEGMVGMKLYNQFKINDPVVYPVIEQFIHYKMIVHVHGESQLGVGGYRMKYDVNNTPTISVPEDFVEIAKRYPEAMFQYAHIGGGGDWEYACKAFKDHLNIYVDTGGSNNDENMVDFAVESLGEDRVFFGCDSSFYQGVGKILSSGLTEMQKRKIFFENYNNLLKLSGRNFN